jgi:hypothetical protein
MDTPPTACTYLGTFCGKSIQSSPCPGRLLLQSALMCPAAMIRSTGFHRLASSRSSPFADCDSGESGLGSFSRPIACGLMDLGLCQWRCGALVE